MFFFFKQKTAYEMRISDWSSDVCSSDLGAAYAQALAASGIEYDMLFGPAYKGIPLVTAVACAQAEQGLDVPYAYNRKEAKDHGEGGTLVGAPPRGRVVSVADVQIGRAQGRERVCQSVQIAVVAVSLKKK